MEFESCDASVVRSIKQREFLNAWLHAAAKHRPLPLVDDFQPNRVGDELADMMGYDVIGEGDSARFLITQSGATLSATYGNDHLKPAERTNRYLDDAVGPERYARVATLYRACLKHKRPAYSISTVQDEDNKDVSYERLLLPFGRGHTVEQIVGSYKSISIEGGFKVKNLMGLRPKAVPVILVRAIIDRDFVPSTASRQLSDEVIELG
ncbi:PAS domain-containing protein [Bradyrhizobium sp. AUGA SZCCT0431]|uniref:PAS domain-containing protein n=1 Tax=Bradyrhizobium sp. AUGA SZCCT0431 TaxID=2807674 RepID=UPI001BAB19A2|nr:PAS domain-containing protein [Bradyrhizobium sp. AUGA SZCCT0431]MBR1146552.1 PAS domain-containing protein [Bradyrhizobium sp. AUGA SZCCT0431]